MADKPKGNEGLERLEALLEYVDGVANRCGADELELAAWPRPKLIQGGEADASPSD